jgi:antitoxin component of MazEF toxin-antitoxin module
MLMRKLNRSGHSKTITIPAHIVELLEMEAGDEIGIEMVDHTIVLHPPIDLAERERRRARKNAIMRKFADENHDVLVKLADL